MILIGVLLLGGYAVGKTLFASKEGPPGKGDKPPAFELAGTDGQLHKLSDYKGKALVINFWGSFCPPCVKETPMLVSQYEKHKGDNLEIIGINLSEDDLTVANFVKDYSMSYPVLRDENKRTEKAYGLRSYPTTFFVRPDGTIMDVLVGEMTQHGIETKIAELLKS